MKKSIEKLVSKAQENGIGQVSGGFASIKGGFSLKVAENGGHCTNDTTCNGTNSGICSNTGTCTDATNSRSGGCTNSGTCYQ